VAKKRKPKQLALAAGRAQVDETLPRPIGLGLLRVPDEYLDQLGLRFGERVVLESSIVSRDPHRKLRWVRECEGTRRLLRVGSLEV
jgi:hypothetical protein